MPRASALYDVFHIDGLARARVKRADTLLDVAPQTMELLKIGSQLAAYLVLRRLRQPRRLGDSIFEYFAHVRSLSRSAVWSPLSGRTLTATAERFSRCRSG
jgi:hypothetical protein